jgi:hypothetical protein
MAYELTGSGHELVDLLERMDTWDALYERYPRHGDDGS